MTKSRFDSRLEDYEDPDEVLDGGRYQDQMARCPDPEHHFEHSHAPHDGHDEPGDLPMEGEHVIDDEGNPEVLAWFQQMWADRAREDEAAKEQQATAAVQSHRDNPA